MTSISVLLIHKSVLLNLK